MYETCIASDIDECPDAVSDESLDGFNVWTCDHVLPGLKSDELQRCSDSMEFLPRMESEEELRETSAEILGSLVNEKSRLRPGTNLGCP